MNSKIRITICLTIIVICSSIEFVLGQDENKCNKMINPILDPKTIINSNNFSTNWIVKPFEQKVFIENKGQFTGKDNLSSSHIKYGVEDQGTQIYFTPKGLTYRFENVEVVEDHKKNTPVSENEKEVYYKDEEIKINRILHTISIEWVNANPDLQIIAEDKVGHYFNYIDRENPMGKSTYFAPGFKKIIYKGLYPGVDVEYTFHEENGIKYAIIVHPDANTSLIKMKYSGIDKIYKDEQDNIHAVSSIGDIIDHAPITYYASKPTDIIPSYFDYEGNIVTFNLSDYDNNKAIIIDPWLVNPLLTVVNKAFNIETDASGNIYVYGGGFPNKLHKYSPIGALIWVLSTPFNGVGFGDLEVDPVGNSYITEGNNAQFAGLAKIDNMGNLNWLSIPTGSYEYWAIGFNCAFNQLVTGGGFKKGLVWNIDTSIGTLGNLNIFNGPSYEIRAMCTAPNNNFYFLTEGELIAVDSAFVKIFRVPSEHLIPYGTTNPPAHSPTYATGFAMGINGIKANSCFIYTTDGLTLIQRSIQTGAIVNTTRIINGVFMGNSGIAIDSCGQVYVGSQGRVNKYDSNLNLISFATIPSIIGSLAVYDVSIGSDGEILACGENFIASIDMSGCNPLSCTSPTLTLDFSSTPASCSLNDGTATVIPTGGAAPYSYSWSTSPIQTTATASGLGSGTYMVTVTDTLGCINLTATNSVIVPNSSGLSASIISSDVTCHGGDNGFAIVYPVGGTDPYTFSWNTTPMQTTDTAFGLAKGSYTCIIMDSNGCITNIVAIISEPPPSLFVSLSSKSISCNGGSDGFAFANGSGGVGPYTFSWNTDPIQINDTVSNLSAGSYICTVTDFISCTARDTITIIEPEILSIIVKNVIDVSCYGGNNGSAIVSGLGGMPPYSYAWAPPYGGTVDTAVGLIADNYTVVIRDTNNCSDSITLTIFEPPQLSLTATEVDSICSGQNVTLVAVIQGGTAPYAFNWNPGSITGNPVTVSPTVSTIYEVVVTDANNCISTSQPVNVNIYSLPDISFTANPKEGCTPLCVSFNNTTPNISDASWNFGDGKTGSEHAITHCFQNPGNYSIAIAVTDNNGCANLLLTPDLIQVFPNPVAAFTMTPPITAPVNSPVLFNDQTSGADYWLWNFGDFLNSTSLLRNPLFAYSVTGSYTVNLLVSNNEGCTDSVLHTIIIEPEFTLYIPNSFTPDNDGLNDFFAPQGTEFDSFEMEIYNRWGERVYHTKEIDRPWDGGVKNGDEIQEGVYVYKILVKDFKAEIHYYVGNVTLIR